MVSLEELYKRSLTEKIDLLIKEYQSQDNFDIDIHSFELLLTDKNTEKVQIIFYIKIFSIVLKKPTDIKTFYTIVLHYIDDNLDYKNSILIFNILNIIINTKLYVPTIFYFIHILKCAITIDNKKLLQTNKKYSLENIKLTSDDIKTVELQLFIVETSILLIQKVMSIYSNSIGYPELCETVCHELKTYCKINEFKSTVNNLIKRFDERKKYIINQRDNYFKKDDILDQNKVNEFEKNIQRIEF